MKQKLTIALLISLMLPAMSLAQKKLVTYQRNNVTKTIAGEVTQTDQGYLVQTEYGPVNLKREEVIKIVDVVQGEDTFDARREKIDDNDLNSLSDLAKWAMDREMYDDAESLLEEILRKNPNHQRSQLLKVRLKELRKQAQTDNSRGNPVRPVPRGTPAQREWLVSMDDIYTIRREELWSADSNTTFQLREDLARRYAQAMRGQKEFRDPNFYDRFLAWGPSRQAGFILNKTKPGNAFRKDILVLRDPQFMQDFTSQVWPLVQNSCASPNCHGGNRPRGGLMLLRNPNANLQMRYTNFVILDGMRDKQGRKVLDRDNPERSLLLEYLLTEDARKYSHPRPIQPVFENRGDRRYRQIYNWVNNLVFYPTRPDYSQLDFKAPFNMKLQFRDPTAAILLGDKASEQKDAEADSGS